MVHWIFMFNNPTRTDAYRPDTDFRKLLVPHSEEKEEDFVLGDGARIAVVGGGPSGSFFSYFAMKMAAILGRKVSITIFEPKDFAGMGEGCCNYCGGIISEIMVQTLAVEGYNIPSSVIQRAINSYVLYTDKGKVRINTPAMEKTIATVHRGSGQKGMASKNRESFDSYLLQRAIESGAEHRPEVVDRIAFENGRPVLFSSGKRLMDADLLVGAYGVNSHQAPFFEEGVFSKSSPSSVKAAITEITLDPDEVVSRFGTSVHLFMLPIVNVRFAAIIPKHSYVTLCILGKNLNEKMMEKFLYHPSVSALFPEGKLDLIGCHCLPMINVGALPVPYADRVVMVGDSGSTRLYKDGIGAAYFMAKSAAKTAIMYGVGAKQFKKHYMPDYRSLVRDNRYGWFLFLTAELFRDSSINTRAMLRLVRKEQEDIRGHRKFLSPVLWDMFTGNERYRNVFWRAINPLLVLKLLKSVRAVLIERIIRGKQ
jgi:flavin-dependent dehydrogenase